MLPIVLLAAIVAIAGCRSHSQRRVKQIRPPIGWRTHTLSNLACQVTVPPGVTIRDLEEATVVLYWPHDATQQPVDALWSAIYLSRHTPDVFKKMRESIVNPEEGRSVPKPFRKFAEWTWTEQWSLAHKESGDDHWYLLHKQCPNGDLLAISGTVSGKGVPHDPLVAVFNSVKPLQ